MWITSPDRTGMASGEYARRLRTEIAALNRAVTDAVDQIIQVSPSAAIILMSDHGIRNRIDVVDEHFRSFFAARTPGYEDVFPDDVSPVNVLRRLLTRVYGERLPDLPYRAWVSDWNKPLDLAPQD
jgi:hypothetical protein